MSEGTVTLAQEQEIAVNGIKAWFLKKNKQTCVLAGYAGTGKTFLVNHIIRELNIRFDQVAFAAFTGKASLIIKENNPNFDVSTVHSLIYDVSMEKNIVTFNLKSEKDLRKYRLIVIDEASMIPKEINDDLLSFGIPVLYIGDQGQLPPISSNNKAVNILDNPDFTLTKIHRQAEDNPIIKLSMLAREGKEIPLGKYSDDVYVLSKGSLTEEQIINACIRSDQVICGYNRTRNDLNKKIREKLGFTSNYPEEGDKLICLRNSWGHVAGDFPLINGMTGFADKVDLKKQPDDFRDVLRVDFKPDFDTTDYFKDLVVLKSDFFGKEKHPLQGWEYGKFNSFDFGYAITCHKSQGSQYNNLVVFNEVLNKKEHNRWLYTAITRSKEKLILIM